MTTSLIMVVEVLLSHHLALSLHLSIPYLSISPSLCPLYIYTYTYISVSPSLCPLYIYICIHSINGVTEAVLRNMPDPYHARESIWLPFMKGESLSESVT